MNSERLKHLVRFYSILDKHEKNIGGARKLADCSGRMSWPERGVYFFREPSEIELIRGKVLGSSGRNSCPWNRVQHKTLDTFIPAQRPAEHRRWQS